MKVETDLKAGSALTSAAQQAEQAAGQVSDFVSKANLQAASFSDNVTTKATSLWNCLQNTFA